MISYKKWKEEFDMSHIMQMLGNSPEEPKQPEKPALADFKSFIKDKSAPHAKDATSGRLSSVKEFIGDLASIPNATNRRQYLNSHGDIRQSLMHMNDGNWAELEKSFPVKADDSPMNDKEKQRMGRALLWLHKEMERFGTGYNRRTKNLSQYDASFRKSQLPKKVDA